MIMKGFFFTFKYIYYNGLALLLIMNLRGHAPFVGGDKSTLVISTKKMLIKLM